jgi:hypothetical protein
MPHKGGMKNYKGTKEEYKKETKKELSKEKKPTGTKRKGFAY